MPSNRPLLPGDFSSRADAWQRGASVRELLAGQTRQQVTQAGYRWLTHSFPGRVLLVAAAIKIQAAIIGFIFPGSWTFLDLVDAVGSLLLLFVVAYLLTKAMVWTKRRLLWRVRRKLILSYVFVGLVPGLLIICFFLIAGFLLFFNVSSYLLQSRVRTLIDQARFTAQSAALEAEHGDAPEVLRRRLEQRQIIAAERYPFTSYAVVPVQNLDCQAASAQASAPARPMSLGDWRHLSPPDRLARWISCEGYAGLVAYEVNDGDPRLVIRAVALPDVRKPQFAVIVDIPFSAAIMQRLQQETGIRMGEISWPDPRVRVPTGIAFEPGPAPVESTAALGRGWVTPFDVQDWETGTTFVAAAAIELNPQEVYQRLSSLSTGLPLGQLLLVALAFIGVLFLTIQFVALVIGFVLARQITGAVHDLFTGTEHLRNRDFTYHIPVRARDQLGELADSFNIMTGEITQLIRENAEKARMEQEMLAAREIQQKLLPSGPLSVPGLSITAFCEPAREVAGDYFDFLRISPTQLGVLIADVSGKGLPAGLYMAQLKVLAQSLARTHTSPREFLKALNRVVADNIDSKSFITMSYGVIDLAAQQMTFARAGHCPLIRVPGAAPAGLRKSEMIAPDGLVLGLKIDDGAMFDGMIQEVNVPLIPGDLIVFYTDGISETMNDTFDCYGEPRLAKVLEQYSHLPFEQLRSFIFADLRSFAGDADQHDDMTMILLKVEEQPACQI